jgi:hypothetical protein
MQFDLLLTGSPLIGVGEGGGGRAPRLRTHTRSQASVDRCIFTYAKYTMSQDAVDGSFDLSW